jgi:archaellum biogenesis protein FlaJ (TadC family)
MTITLSLQAQIIALWTVFLFGTVFHTQLALMPLLYGSDVAIPRYHGKTPVSHLWGMLGFFILPMVMILLTALNASPLYRTIHLGITGFYTVMNFLHVTLDLRVKPIEWYQIALVSVLFGVGLVLNLLAYQWMMQPGVGM